ncbi:MAG: hypothetical protein ACE15B_15550 [Bryobacteraceae bacterium]
MPVLLVLLLCAASAQAATGVRLLFGLTDKAEEKWDGSVTVRNARLVNLEGWRFEGQDQLQPGNAWRVGTHPIRLFGGGRAGAPAAVVANGVIVWLDGEGPGAELDVKTAQGNFTVRLSAIPYGVMEHFLNGRAAADRLPPFTRLTTDSEEQDYPAAAVDAKGDVWLAYIEFRHNPRHHQIRQPVREPITDFTDLKAPTGGDRVLVRRLSAGAWGQPMEITPPGGDLYRPAIAVDGSGRAWVFWSANQKGNFDLWARVIENGKPGATVRVTGDPGADAFPAAATDSKGAVWVAWQGWRNGKAAIFAAMQRGNRFTTPVQVSQSQANEWNPAIAADGRQKVTIAWDSYRNGSYDVYSRTAQGISNWGPETPLAASARYEAYPSIAYDRQGRLWAAYEEGSEGWGKNFGAYDTTGIALYQGRAIRLRAFEGAKAMDAASDIGSVLPGAPDRRADAASRQSEVTGWERPDAARAARREPSRTPVPPPSPRNTMPRLTVDSSGRVWVAFRSSHPIWWNPIGTVWTEYVASYDGTRWTGPIFLAHSDNLLDNRPAVLSRKPGELLVLNSSDGRRVWPEGTAALRPAQKRRAALKSGAATPQAAAVGMGNLPHDPYQNDLYCSTIELPAAAGPAALRAGAPVTVAGPLAPDKSEQAAAALLRSHKIGNLKLIRGEFHRHSEISMDGGNDGTILDQWRYMLDPAHMDWVGCCDHDNGGAREYSWWTTQKLTDLFYSPGRFVPMFSYERSVSYPEGHRNVVFVQRGIRPLPRLPKVDESAQGHAPDTQMLYKYLRFFDGVVASHTSGTNMGTDWRDNDPLTEPVVEIYQGDRQNYEMPDAPRSNSENDSIGGWRPKGFVNLALEAGYKMGFQASSDHISTHMSYCNIFAVNATREALLDGLKKRHVYGATENILADFRSGPHMMGDAFTSAAPPDFQVRLVGTAPFAKVHVIKDNKYVYTSEPKTATVQFTWRDNAPTAGKTSYYYVRGEQTDGEIVWVSPMWVTYSGK